MHRLIPLVLLIALDAPRLEAETVDPRLFDATVSPGALIGLDSAWLPAHLEGYLGVGLSYANDELVGADGGERTRRGPLSARWTTTFAAGLGLFDRLELQLGMPLHAHPAPVEPRGPLGPDGEADTFAPADLRVALRVGLVAPARSGLGVVLQLAAFLPTGGQIAYSGDERVVFDPRLVADWRGDHGLAVAAHLGYRFRPAREVIGLTIEDEVRYGVGLELPVGALGLAAPLSFLLELEGALGLGEAARSQALRPLEGRLGLRLFSARWSFTLASGAGLTDGYGAPDLRFFAGLAWSFGAGADDARPRPTALARRSRAAEPGPAPAFEALPGLDDPATFERALADDPDGDLDGVPSPADRCPSEAEDHDGHEDGDGCPDPDNDGDGVLDLADRCPTEAETPNGVDDDDGCPDEGQGAVLTRDGVIELAQTIEFQSGSDVLLASATPLIAEIAAVLKANPAIKRVRIEGHTDGEGDAEMNVDLSERRAARVRQKLIALGVAPERLLPRGYGATRAIATNATVEGRKKNRRVVFRVIDPPPPGAPRVDFEEGAP